jgi:subtilisin family serine protease
MPTDPLVAQQWHLNAVNAPAAWQWLSDRSLPPGGARSIVVAVIDTGVDYNHQDLAANMWTNGSEIPGNGIDDDRDGYVDDVHGANMITPSGNPMDDHGHGTHVSGIAAGVANNGGGAEDDQ